MLSNEIRKIALKVKGNDRTEPYIEAHRRGADTLEIDMMLVPERERGKGVGRDHYLAWEKKLSKTIKYITLFAADTGGTGNSDAFWERMGFEYQYDDGGEGLLSYEASHRMHKGINGAATPLPELVLFVFINLNINCIIRTEDCDQSIHGPFEVNVMLQYRLMCLVESKDFSKETRQYYSEATYRDTQDAKFDSARYAAQCRDEGFIGSFDETIATIFVVREETK